MTEFESAVDIKGNRVTRQKEWRFIADIAEIATTGSDDMYVIREIESICPKARQGRGVEVVHFECGSNLRCIRAEAFQGTAIRYIVIPARVVEIGERAFDGCRGLKEVAFEKDSALVTIRKRAFGGTGIRSMWINGSVREVDGSAFAGCDAETFFVDSKNICFVGCGSLLLSYDRKKIVCCAGRNVTIPMTVNEIGNMAFCGSIIDALVVPKHVKMAADDSFTECCIKSLEFTDPGLMCKYVGANLQGIIAHLTRQCGGNVVDKAVVGVSVKSTSGFYRARNAFDHNDTESFYMSQLNGPDQWLCIDFGTLKVRPTHYTLCGIQLKSWIIQASGDGSDWTQIDCRDDQDMREGKPVSFTVVTSGDFRLICLRQTGKNRWNKDFMHVVSIEIFGTLIRT